MESSKNGLKQENGIFERQTYNNAQKCVCYDRYISRIIYLNDNLNYVICLQSIRFRKHSVRRMIASTSFEEWTEFHTIMINESESNRWESKRKKKKRRREREKKIKKKKK